MSAYEGGLGRHISSLWRSSAGSWTFARVRSGGSVAGQALLYFVELVRVHNPMVLTIEYFAFVTDLADVDGVCQQLV